jgi:hypothetical protein
MEDTVMKRIVAAAAIAAVLWVLKRWRDYERARLMRAHPHATENWENEGGALEPHPAGLETSQVPR